MTRYHAEGTRETKPIASMHHSAFTAALLLSAVYGLAYDTPSKSASTAVPYTRHCYSIAVDLASSLSPHAAILLPGNGSFHALEIRASSPRIEPTFTAIVEVATEEDIQQTVCQNVCLFGLVR